MFSPESVASFLAYIRSPFTADFIGSIVTQSSLSTITPPNQWLSIKLWKNSYYEEASTRQETQSEDGPASPKLVESVTTPYHTFRQKMKPCRMVQRWITSRTSGMSGLHARLGHIWAWNCCMFSTNSSKTAIQIAVCTYTRYQCEPRGFQHIRDLCRLLYNSTLLPQRSTTLLHPSMDCVHDFITLTKKFALVSMSRSPSAPGQNLSMARPAKTPHQQGAATTRGAARLIAGPDEKQAQQAFGAITCRPAPKAQRSTWTREKLVCVGHAVMVVGGLVVRD